MTKFFYKILVLFFFSGISSLSAQLVVNSGVSQNQLMDMIVGDNVTISNIQLNCKSTAYSTFEGYNSNLGIDSGIILSTGSVLNAVGPNDDGGVSSSNSYLGDSDLDNIVSPYTTEDACVLEFDIAPNCDTLGIKFVFGSEEYPEYVNSYNDAFAFFISGPGMPFQNIALLPNSTIPVTISNVNNGPSNTGPCSNCSYYTPNGDGSFGTPQYSDPTVINYDGFTVPLLAKVAVNPCDTYHMKLAIADAGDDSWDSGVFIEAKGLSCVSNKSIEMSVDSLVSCNQINGALSVSVNSGSGPFTYVWSDGSSVINTNIGSSDSIHTLTGLSSGMYYVSVSDASSCDKTDSIYLDEVSTIAHNVNILSQVSCAGYLDGSLEVSFTGGMPGYEFLWYDTHDTLKHLLNISDTVDTLSGLAAGKYYVKVSDLSGCYFIDSFDIQAQYEPLLNLTVGASLSCYGDTAGKLIAQTNLTGMVNYIWGGLDTIRNDTMVSIVDSVIDIGPGIYWVEIIDSNGCSSRDSIELSEPSALSLILDESVPFLCYGNNDASIVASLSGGTGPYDLSWSNGQNSFAVTTIDSIVGLGGGMYYLNVVDSNYCSVSDSLSLFVDSMRIEPLLVQDESCENSANGIISFSIENKQSIYDIIWTDSNNQQIYINQLYSSQSDTLSGLSRGWYKINVTDSSLCIKSDSLYVDTIYEVKLDIGGLHELNCYGDSNAFIHALMQGGLGPYTFIWGADSIIKSISSDTLLDLQGGSYILSVMDSNNCKINDSVMIYEPERLGITSLYIDSVKCKGQSNGSIDLTFSGGSPYYELQFYELGVFNVTQTIGYDTSFSINALDSGSFVIIIRDSLLCLLRDTIDLYEPDSLGFSFWQNNPILCYGDSNGGILLDGYGGVADYTYYYSFNGSVLDSGNMSFLDTSQLHSLHAGKYLLELKDANDCIISDSFELNQPDSLAWSFQPMDTNRCYGDSMASLILSYSGGNGPYEMSWIINADTFYHNSNVFSLSDTINGMFSGNYQYQYTDINGCEFIDSLWVSQPDILAHTNTIVQESCIDYCDGSFNLQVYGGVPNYTIVWSNAVIGAQNLSLCPDEYIVTITDNNNCELFDTFTIVAPDSILASIQLFDICEDSFVNFVGSVSSGNITQWGWNLGNGTLATGDSIFASYDSAATYYICMNVLTDLGCRDTICDSMYVYPNPQVSIAADTLNGCSPLSVNFSSATPDSNLTYIWSFGDGSYDTSANSTHQYVQAGLYNISFKATNIYGCSDWVSYNDWIEAYPVPISSFTVDKSIMKITNANVEYTDLSTGASYWKYSFGNGDSSFTQNGIHEFLDTGIYSITQIAFNEYDCADSSILTIEIDPDLRIYMPTAFTPNNDQINDEFGPIGRLEEISKYDFHIYNRWGDRIFETNDFTKRWDGYFNNKLAQQGGYVYLLKIRSSWGEAYEYKGTFLLIHK